MPQTHKHSKGLRSTYFPYTLGWISLLVFLMLPQAATAQQTWNAYVGADTPDHAGQADAFLPNEMWIHAGDSIQWTWQPQNQLHTVSFLAPATQIRPTPPPPIGPPVGPPFIFSNECPSPNPYNGGTATYNGSACVSSANLNGGTAPSTFTVTFPNPGNYKLLCLIHTNMNGTVHVLGASASLPYAQSDYNQQAQDEAQFILANADNPSQVTGYPYPRSLNEVLMTGQMVATGGGRQFLAIVRFFPQTIYINQGDTVEFTNVDPAEPHTVTSGMSDTLANDMALVNVSPASDGALTGTVNTAGDFGNATSTTGLNSGFLQASPEDAAGRAQSLPGTTRIRVQFNIPGTFYYHCALHDVDGMQGSVVVNPLGSRPTALLTANGSHNITAAVGSTINYTWSSAGAVSAVSAFTVSGGSPSSWVGNSLSGSVSGTVAASQAGKTYVITYTVINSAGQTASDQVTITVP